MKLPTLDFILFERKGLVATLFINNPTKLNALSPQVMKELNEILDYVEKENEIKVLIITGVGDKAFVVGNDVTQLSELSTSGAYEQMIEGQKTFLRIYEFPKPVIAMVNGYALGGGFELALSCDFIIASTKAKFGFPEINLNTMPGWGGTQLSIKKMGINYAKEMLLTGNYYSSEEAEKFGFINKVASPNELQKTTMDFVNNLTNKVPYCLKVIKELTNKGENLDIATGFKLEASVYAVNFSTLHAKDGFKEFLNKEKVKGEKFDRAKSD